MTADHQQPGREVIPLHASDVSYEIELDDAPPPGLPVLVDPPAPAARRLPVIPASVATLPAARATLARHAGRAGHAAAFHTVRSPAYLAKTAAYALGGVFIVGARHLRWWFLLEQGPVRSKAAADGDAKAWLSLHQAAVEARKFRGIITAIAVAVLAVGAFLLSREPWWTWALALAVVLPLLAWAGKPKGRPIITPATVTPRFRRLNADIVLRAYYAAKLGDPDKPGMQVTFGSPMARDGEGSRVEVDLPYGLGLDDAVKAKDKIASGLDVTASQVFIRRDPTSHRRHTLWVADRDPLAVPVGRTPLLACRQTDIWRPAPVGLDERGQLVTVPLLWHSVLVGALPRQGKTFAARLLALYAALDPFCALDVFDGKGSPDWRRFALVADSHAFGLTPTRDGLPPEILLATLQRIKDDVQDRYHKLSDMDPRVCPEGKLTRDIARDPRYGMPVRFLVLDEVQEYFDLGEISKDIAALLVFLLKVAPGAGVSVLAATQKPGGIGTGQVAQQFTSFRDNFAIRFGLRTSSWQVSELVLGAGAYSEGLDTSVLLPQYKGVGILRGASDASPTVRTYLADGQDAEKILTAARQLRGQAGTLTGMAAGQGYDRGARDVLGDVLAVFGADPGLHWPVLAQRLAQQFPDRWADATGDSVSAQCRALGVPSVDVKQAGVNLKGCRRGDVETPAGR